MTVAFNALTEIPVELPLRLPHLSNLDLSYNQLQSLPQSFGLLFHLKELHLQHNRISLLPESFVHLVKLEKVDLSHNDLRLLPDGIGTMERLNQLNVVHNKLKMLPLSLGSPSCRVHLLLAQQNRLESPPQAIADEGSDSTLEYICKRYKNSCEEFPSQPTVPLNCFPRHCGSKLEPCVNNPHSAQIQYIQEQTHTTHSSSRIKTPLLPPLNATCLNPFQLRDRVVGLIYGAAIGDAIGLACRWMSKDECAFHYTSDDDLIYSNIVQDEHRVLWRQGDWSSNFDQFMLILDSLVGWAGVIDELDFARRLQAWSRQGFPELGDSGGIFISETVREVVSHSDFTEDPHLIAQSVLQKECRKTVSSEEASVSGHTHDKALPESRLPSLTSSFSELLLCNHIEVAQRLVFFAPRSEFGLDNGAIVRTAILGVPNFHDLQEVEGNAVRICRSTHADSRCVASCVLISLLVAFLLQGKLMQMDCKLPTVTEDQLDFVFDKAASHLFSESDKDEFLQLKTCRTFTSLNVNSKNRMSHTFTPIKAAMVALYWREDYRTFISALTRKAGDSNSNACVAGAILGCRLGYSKLPPHWLHGLRKRQADWLVVRINHLLDMMGSP